MSYKIYSDGCYLTEFEVAGVGGYLLNNDATVFEFSEQIEEKAHHTVHERFALKRVLEKSLEAKIEHDPVELFSDDQGLMKVLASAKRRDYAQNNPLLTQICDLCDKFKDITFTYIPREENKRADKLSRQNIIDNLFKKNQLTMGAFSHPKWISKNSFPKEDTRSFNTQKQSVSQYLVVHLYNREKEMQLDIYYAKKDDTVAYELKEQTTPLQKGWQESSLLLINKHLQCLSQDNKAIGVVMHDEYIILDQLLRGRRDIPNKCKSAFDSLTLTLEGLDKVVIHREPSVYQEIFKDNAANMKAKIKYKA